MCGGLVELLVPDSINLENACKALETLAREQAPSSPELDAIELAAHALLFLTAPRPPIGSEHLQIEDVDPRTILKEWSSQGHLFEAYLAPWKEQIAQHGTDEQRAFLAHLGQGYAEDAADVGDEHDIETRPIADALPGPDQALRTLEALAQRHAADSLNRTRVEFAAQVLRYVADRDQVGTLGKYLACR